MYLLGLGLAAAGLGALLQMLAGREGAAPAIESAIGAMMADPIWHPVLLGAGGMTCLAVGLTILDGIVPWRSRRDGKDYAELESGALRPAIAEVRARVEECVGNNAEDVSSALDELIRGALKLEASDLHLSPTPQGMVATYRVHGALHEVALLPKELAPRMATRVKVLARLDAFSQRPQDGKLRHRVGDAQLEARVSTLQADLGERVVLRLVKGGLAVPSLEQLGFPEGTENRLAELLARPQGMIFVSGPVGSGKTTTLYSSLQHIAQTRGKTTSLVSLEDPIELQLPFATQTQINAKVGMSFAQTLRSVLRQDPNVLMLGEIRDRETAEIATQAGLTGHMILTTLHVDRAAGTFARMIEMGVEPFVLASTTVGAVAQRLVRTLCTHCRRPAKLTELELERFERLGIELPGGEPFEAVGCEFCEGQGYTGRVPIVELLVMTPELRKAVNDRLTAGEITALAQKQGMVTLAEAGMERVKRGETSIAELLRVVA